MAMSKLRVLDFSEKANGCVALRQFSISKKLVHACMRSSELDSRPAYSP